MSEPKFTENQVGSILAAISSVTLVVGVIAGIILGFVLESITIFFYLIIASLVTSAVYAGFAEIIKLLQKLVDIEYFSISINKGNQTDSHRSNSTPNKENYRSNKTKTAKNLNSKKFDLDKWKKDNP